MKAKALKLYQSPCLGEQENPGAKLPYLKILLINSKI